VERHRGDYAPHAVRDGPAGGGRVRRQLLDALEQVAEDARDETLLLAQRRPVAVALVHVHRGALHRARRACARECVDARHTATEGTPRKPSVRWR
jgi:hypothetical protein